MTRALAVLTLALAPLALAGTGCKTKIDGEKANELVKKMMAEKGITVTPSCPGGFDAKKGGKFVCAATDEQGQKHTINVEIIDDKGTVSAVLVGTIIDTEKLLPDVKKAVGSDALVMNCPAKVVVVTHDRPVKCTVSIDGASREMTITETDAEKHLVDWKIAGDDAAPPAATPPT
ncbi:MAG: DUF4333 domain-containing protein [Myxococcota bacterium]|nr:DUF4333 domain-containing protein [Myxococcota bacterium]